MDDYQVILNEVSEENKKKKLALGDEEATIKTSKVEIVDIDMPFLSMVVFMIKWAVASIPALIVLYILFIAFGGTLVAILK